MSLLEELDREGLSALAAEILTALEEAEQAASARRRPEAFPEGEAALRETPLPPAAGQQAWRAAALRKGAGAETAGAFQEEAVRQETFFRARQQLSAALDGMRPGADPAGEGLSPPEAAYLRGGEASTARQTGDLPREDRTARREAEAVSRILERGARGYDAGFIHY